MYGSAFRLPTVFELGFEDEGQNFIPNPNLQPEKIRQLELVWEGRLTPEVLVRDIAVQTADDRSDQTADRRRHRSTQYLNLTDVTSQGVEMQADYRRS